MKRLLVVLLILASWATAAGASGISMATTPWNSVTGKDNVIVDNNVSPTANIDGSKFKDNSVSGTKGIDNTFGSNLFKNTGTPDNAANPRWDNTWQTGGYTLGISCQGGNPVDNVIYYFGAYPSVAFTAGVIGFQGIPIPVDGIVSIVKLRWYGSTVAGTAEEIVLNMIVDNTTVYRVGSVADNAASKHFDNTAMAVSVNAGSHLEFSLGPTTWAGAGNPTGVKIAGEVYIKYR